MDIELEDVEKAFRVLPHQGTGVYRLDNCKCGKLISLKASDPYEVANVCPHCLALILSDKEEVEQS